MTIRKGGERACKVCTHPGKADIERLIYTPDISYTDIVEKMAELYPGAPRLSPAGISRHKKDHLQTRAITVTDQTGQQMTVLPTSPVVKLDKTLLPEQTLSLSEALNLIIVAGAVNILENPSQVRPKHMLEALEIRRKLEEATGSGNLDEFNAAWEKVQAARAAKAKKTTRRRKVTLEETVEEEDTSANPARDGEIIEASGDWSDQPALPAPEDDE